MLDEALAAANTAARDAQRQRTKQLLENKRKKSEEKAPPPLDHSAGHAATHGGHHDAPRRGRCRACCAVLITSDQGPEVHGWLLFKIARAPIIIVAGLYLAQPVMILQSTFLD